MFVSKATKFAVITKPDQLPHALFRSPLHAKTSYGKSTRGFAESLDFYRTLVGLAAPSLSSKIEPSVEGVNLTPLFEQPELAPGQTGPHNASFSQMARCPCGRTYPCFSEGIESACNSVPRNITPFMGYTVRTDRWRYTVWIPFDGASNRGKWSAAAANISRSQELYDHSGDTGTNWADGFENVNEAANYTEVVEELFQMLTNRFDTPTSMPWPPNVSPSLGQPPRRVSLSPDNDD